MEIRTVSTKSAAEQLYKIGLQMMTGVKLGFKNFRPQTANLRKLLSNLEFLI